MHRKILILMESHRISEARGVIFGILGLTCHLVIGSIEIAIRRILSGPVVGTFCAIGFHTDLNQMH